MATALTVNPSATLTIDNTGSNSFNRVADASTLTLNGGNFNYVGAAASNTAELLGALTVNAGNSVVTSTSGAGGGSLLAFASLAAHVTGGVLTFAAGGGQTLGLTNQIQFIAAPAVTVGNVIKGAITNDAAAGTINLAVYNAATGISALPAASTAPPSPAQRGTTARTS